MVDEQGDLQLDALLTGRNVRWSLLLAIVALSALTAGCGVGDESAASPTDPPALVTDAPASQVTTPASETSTGTNIEPPVSEPTTPRSLTRLAGGLVMTGVTRASGAPDPALFELAGSGLIGGLIVTDTSSMDPSSVLEPLQEAAVSGGNPRLVVAIDQEGGAVRRLQDSAPLASHAELGRRAVAETSDVARRAGCAMTRRGITLDLAPVADVVVRRDGFLAQSGRSFGSSVDLVAPRVDAFVSGLRTGGVGATLKHFPGLGTAGATTDFTLSESLPDPGAIQPFIAGVRSGALAVMMSSATYSTGPFRSRIPAFATAAPYQWLRANGFAGVMITDDLSTDAIAGDPRLPHPAVQAIASGADMVLFVDTTGADAREAVTDLVDAVQAGRLSRSRLVEAWRHVAQLRVDQSQFARTARCG